MTAEIAILNKHAVALAADSAVTIGRQLKTYNSANKLFMLSKYAPVGVLIYGGAEFMGIPWETIFKQYREKLGSSRFPTLEEYCCDFRRFLTEGLLFDEEIRKKEVLSELIRGVLQGVVQKVNKVVQGRLSDSSLEEIESTLASIAKDVLKEEQDRADTRQDLPDSLSSRLLEELEAHRDLIDSLAVEAFENFPLSNGLEEQVASLVRTRLCKDEWSQHHSGIVIAGYGEKEVFPRIRAYRLESLIGKTLKLKLEQGKCFDVEHGDSDAAIIPFAQSDMVDTFVAGVDPDYRTMAEGYLDTLFSGLPERMSSVLSNTIRFESDDAKQASMTELEDKLSAVSRSILREFKEKMREFQYSRYINATVNVVGFLPVDELASMAETLVSLTSFKRRMSMSAETVGGPVDVAVISKGDGFIWIKRKHYFEPDLNHGFFSNYFQSSSDSQGGRSYGPR